MHYFEGNVFLCSLSMMRCADSRRVFYSSLSTEYMLAACMRNYMLCIHVRTRTPNAMQFLVKVTCGPNIYVRTGIQNVHSKARSEAGPVDRTPGVGATNPNPPLAAAKSKESQMCRGGSEASAPSLPAACAAAQACTTATLPTSDAVT